VITALVYAELTATFVNTVVQNTAEGDRFVPEGVSVNVNFPDTSGGCDSADNFSWVFSRIHASADAEDVETCGSTTLPAESDVVDTDGCFASVSVFAASNKSDVSAATQQVVFDKVSSILSCLP
jgi:5'-nucleotidase